MNTLSSVSKKFGAKHGEHLVTSTGNYVYVQGRPRVGVPVTFLNDGGKAAVINSGSLTLYDGSNSFYFDLMLSAPSAEKWTDDGVKIKPVPAALVLFSPTTIKAGDATEGVFYFDPRLPDFRFRADTTYRAELKFSSKAAEKGGASAFGSVTSRNLASATVDFRIDPGTAGIATQYPEVTSQCTPACPHTPNQKECDLP